MGLREQFKYVHENGGKWFNKTRVQDPHTNTQTKGHINTYTYKQILKHRNIQTHKHTNIKHWNTETQKHTNLKTLNH